MNAERTPYYLEERLKSNPLVVHCAWSFATKEEAEEKLLSVMRAHGHLAMYSLYFEVG
jgi:hypothetical protein